MELVIDSATAACSVALIDGPRVVDQRHELVGRGHAERLLPMIDELLGGRRPTAILVDCGPGSFTGVRVGLAAAHGLAIGWGVPLHGILVARLDRRRRRAERSGGCARMADMGSFSCKAMALIRFAPLDALHSLPPDLAARSHPGRAGARLGRRGAGERARRRRGERRLAPRRRRAPAAGGAALAAAAADLRPRARREADASDDAGGVERRSSVDDGRRHHQRGRISTSTR